MNNQYPLVMPDTTILTVNWNCSELIGQFISNAVSKAQKPEQLKVLVIDNTNGSDERIGQLSAGCEIPCDIRKFDPKGLAGSRAHAAGLDFGLSLIDTEYLLVVDPDIYIFKNNWDSLCIDLLSENDTIAAGVPYPPWKTGKYHDFPSPPFSFFKTEFLKDINASWQPFSRSKLIFWCHFLIRQLGRLGPIITRRTFTNYSLARWYSGLAEKTLGMFSPDTGYLIANEAKRKGLKSVVFDTVTENDIHLAKQSEIEIFCELASQYEFFYYNGDPFAVHKYGSAGWPWRTKRGHDESHWRKCIKEFEEKTAN